MTSSRIIAIGASAGGVAALRALVGGLTKPLPAPLFVVLHVGAHRSELPALLSTAGVMPAVHGEDGMSIEGGRIYVAPPDRHMLVIDGRLKLSRGPKENWVRPAIDPLFRSVAEAYGPRAIGVILTGNLNDGTAGLYEIKRRGGLAIAQDPNSAAYPDMPRSAQQYVVLDYCLALAKLPGLLATLVTQEEIDVTDIVPEKEDHPGEPILKGEGLDRPITITCPDCGGALRRSQLGAIIKYDCHIGHAYTAGAMAAAQFDEMEKVMRAAERILNERAEFCRQMAESVDAQGGEADGKLWRSACQEALNRSYTLRDFIEQDWLAPQASYAGAVPQVAPSRSVLDEDLL